MAELKVQAGLSHTNLEQSDVINYIESRIITSIDLPNEYSKVNHSWDWKTGKYS